MKNRGFELMNGKQWNRNSPSWPGWYIASLVTFGQTFLCNLCWRKYSQTSGPVLLSSAARGIDWDSPSTYHSGEKKKTKQNNIFSANMYKRMFWSGTEATQWQYNKYASDGWPKYHITTLITTIILKPNNEILLTAISYGLCWIYFFYFFLSCGTKENATFNLRTSKGLLISFYLIISYLIHMYHDISQYIRLYHSLITPIYQINE